MCADYPSTSPASRDAGLACVLLLARFFAINADIQELRRRFGACTALDDIQAVVLAARHAGLKARAFGRRQCPSLSALPLPALVRLDDGCFLVVAGAPSRRPNVAWVPINT